VAAEGDVVVEAEGAEIRADVVSTGGRPDDEPEPRELRDEGVSFAAVEREEPRVVLRTG
jgi:hypothetical protein